MSAIDLVGQRFRKLLVRERYKGLGLFVEWICVCDCEVVVIVKAQNLSSGRTGSCGCLSKGVNRTHGMTKSPEYRVWLSMIQRCHNPLDPDYKHYGGRGIRVCEQWRASFTAFYKEVRSRPSAGHSIDRIDNDGDYEPENVRWATKLVQAQNKR